MRVVEAAWLAVRRGDARALAAPDAWARDYLEGQSEDERLSAVRLLDKPDVWAALVAEAARMRKDLEKREAKTPVTAARAANLVSTFMPSALIRVASEITGAAGGSPAKGYDEAKATIAREYKRAWEKGKRLDDEKVARLTLRAFTNSDVAGSTFAKRRTWPTPSAPFFPPSRPTWSAGRSGVGGVRRQFRLSASPTSALQGKTRWKQSGRLDSNQRPLDPQSSALTRLRYAPKEERNVVEPRPGARTSPPARRSQPLRAPSWG
jgi:hypothetical protein